MSPVADVRPSAVSSGRPAGPPVAEHACRVISNAAVNPEYRHLVLDAPRGAFDAAAGQFFHLLCPPAGSDAPFLRRPMSVYRGDPDRRCIEFLYKVQGAGTRGLASLEPGDLLNVLGPLGQGFRLDPGWRHVVVVGRGVGLATLAPLAEAARRRGIGATAVLSARNRALLMTVEDLERSGAEILTVTDEEGNSGPVHVERLLRRLIAEGKADAFFTCGSNRLLLLLQRLARENGIPGQVALEQQMACGLGMCFCCVREFRVQGEIIHRRVCWDGPVFDLQEALSW